MFQNVMLSRSNIANNTESSSACLDLFGSTDRSCLSATGGDVADDLSSVSSRSPKPQLTGCQTPHFRINSSLDLSGKKPEVVPKPAHLANAQVQTG